MLDRLLLTRLQWETARVRRALTRELASVPRHAPPPPSGPLRVLMAARYGEHNAGTKYRLAVWGRRLRAAGHEVRLVLPWDEEVAGSDRDAVRRRHRGLLRTRDRLLRLAGEHHVTVVHMSDLPGWEYGEPWVAELLSRLTGRLLIDLDDLPVVRGEGAIRPRMERMCELADALIVGNEELPRRLPDVPWTRVPTCVDPSEWRLRERGTDGPVVLGWVGTRGNLRYLEPLADVLRDVCADGRARVRVICDREPRLPGVPVEFVPWSFEREVEDLLPIDVGLAPLDDGPMERCKCGLKALQYMAAGAPVVASPVGALADIVSDGRTGFHADGPEAWRRALQALVSGAGLRLAAGRAARASVEEHWSFDAHAESFLSALRGESTSPPASSRGLSAGP